MGHSSKFVRDLHTGHITYQVPSFLSFAFTFLIFILSLRKRADNDGLFSDNLSNSERSSLFLSGNLLEN
ncbi:hypothetical protein ES703_108137 [subsurface metagenome]